MTSSPVLLSVSGQEYSTLLEDVLRRHGREDDARTGSTGSDDVQINPDPNTDLFRMCDEQFQTMRMLQNQITLAESDSGDIPQEQVILSAIATELKECQNKKPELLPTNPALLLGIGQEELQTLKSQLDTVHSCSLAKRESLRETLAREQKRLEEQKEMLTAATEQLDRERSQQLAAQQPGGRNLTKLEEENVKKIKKMKKYKSTLIETLSDILSEHFPLPQEESISSKKQKNIPQNLDENLLSLNEIIERMINQVLHTTHTPYVTIDETFWPPYVEMLLRYEIAVTHPEDRTKIRLDR